MPQKTLAQAARAEDSRLMCFCKFVFFLGGSGCSPKCKTRTAPVSQMKDWVMERMELQVYPFLTALIMFIDCFVVIPVYDCFFFLASSEKF